VGSSSSAGQEEATTTDGVVATWAWDFDWSSSFLSLFSLLEISVSDFYDR